MSAFVLEDEEGVEITVPTVKIVCPRCRGTGVHDHAAFANGISSEEFDEDPDFREQYFAGRYDVTCSECGGANVIDVPDEERMSADLLERLLAHRRMEASFRAEVEAERRMGA